MRVETREVLAGAYLRGRMASMLTHAVEIGADGAEARVLCGRVRLDSIADAGSLGIGGRDEPPTCRVCASRDPRKVK